MAVSASLEGAGRRCAECGAEIAPALRVCPGCLRLVHAEELKALAAEATRAEGQGDLAAALSAWRRAQELLPAGTRQHTQVTDKVTQLSRTVDGGALPSTSSPRSGAGAPRSLAARGAAGATAFGLFVWKFKFLITGALSQGKLLLLGFTKVGTLFTMLLSLGVYWTAFGWKFAAGLIGSMYVHEIGHVAALRRYGIAASAPMFLPGLGAVVRLKQYPATPSEDARVGLAGPLWGLGAAVVAYGVALATGWPSWMAIARMGAWLNLFNLLPVWQLDGGRGFRALARRQRWIATAAIGVAWLATGQGLLMLLLLAAVARSFSREAPTTSDRRALIEYVVLVGVLSALASIEVPQVSGSGP